MRYQAQTSEPRIPPAAVVGFQKEFADFAAVDVNIWITPTEANLDPTTGGPIVHDVDAPLGAVESSRAWRSSPAFALARRAQR
jgi:hypothetical protein